MILDHAIYCGLRLLLIRLVRQRRRAGSEDDGEKERDDGARCIKHSGKDRVECGLYRAAGKSATPRCFAHFGAATGFSRMTDFQSFLKSTGFSR